MGMKIKEWLQSLSFRTGVIVLITFELSKHKGFWQDHSGA